MLLGQTRAVWMGPQGGEAWVKAPSDALDMSAKGWSSGTAQLGGGITVADSGASHLEYMFAWSADSPAVLQPIIDMTTQARAFGELVYYVDPFAAHANLLPAHWASPALQTNDAPPWGTNLRPSSIATPANAKNLPRRTANFNGTSTTTRSLYIPSPPGFAVRMGIYGPAAVGAKFTLTRLNGTAVLTATDLDVIANTDFGVGASTTITDGAETGVTLQMKAGAQTNLQITAAFAQLVPLSGAGVAVPTSFIGGTGNTGLRLVGQFTRTGYGPEASLIAISGRFAEVGDWQ